jgi:hypothetical protein
MKDNYSDIAPVKVKDPAQLTVGSDTEEDIDLRGYDSATLIIDVSDGTASETNDLIITLQHADDDGTGSAGAYADVEETDVLGADDDFTSGAVLTITEDETIQKIGYVGDKRFLKVGWEAEASFDCVVGISLLKGNPIDAPV